MNKLIRKISIMLLVIVMSLATLPSTIAFAKNGFNKKPDSSVGFKEDKKTNGQKVKAPSGDYGWKDEKGRIWIPDGKMHGGQGWTREYPKDGSHDHVYEDGTVRVHKSESNEASTNWVLLALGLILLGVTIFSPVPGDELIIGGALFGL